MASWRRGEFLAISLLLAVVFTTCSDKIEIPEDVLTKEEMVSVMIRVHLIESKVGKLGQRSDSSKALFDHFERLMIEKKGYDTVRYNRSLSFYTRHPKIFRKVYEAVVDSLMEMDNKRKLFEEEKKRLELKEKKKRQKRRDSLKKTRRSMKLSDSLKLIFDEDTIINGGLEKEESQDVLRIPLRDSLNADRNKSYQLKRKLKN